MLRKNKGKKRNLTKKKKVNESQIVELKVRQDQRGKEKLHGEKSPPYAIDDPRRKDKRRLNYTFESDLGVEPIHKASTVRGEKKG